MAAMWALLITHLLLLLPVLRASVEFELHGNVYPVGHIYVAMSIGEPARPYFLDIDSGGPLIWLECDFPSQSPHKGPHPMYKPPDAPSNKVACEDERCATVHGDLLAEHDCSQNPDRCDYKIKYVDEWSTGVLLADRFSLPTGNEDRPNMVFGCGYKQEGGQAQSAPVDGILGISRGAGDFASQLKQQGIITENVIGHCIGDINGGGFLFFGGDSDRVPNSGVTWLPMAPGVRHYSPGEATLNLNLLLEYPVTMVPMTTIFDSGSTYTYLDMTTYGRLLFALGIALQGSSFKRAHDDPTLPICLKDIQPIGSVDDVKDKFRPLDLTFGIGDNQVTLQIPPENYIIVSDKGNVCLGILNGSEAGLKDETIVIGGNAMQNHIVIYDNERARIGWVRASCEGIPGHEPLIGSRL